MPGNSVMWTRVRAGVRTGLGQGVLGKRHAELLLDSAF